MNIDLSKMTISGLLSAHSAVLDELRERGILRSKNNPTGDYAEWLVSTKLGLDLADKSAKGFDATDAAGCRYQIKARRVTPDNPSTQLGAIRNLGDCEFDFLVAVVFDAEWRVLRAAKIPYSVVKGVKGVKGLVTFRRHTNAHIMHLRPAVLAISGVEDISTTLGD